MTRGDDHVGMQLDRDPRSRRPGGHNCMLTGPIGRPADAQVKQPYPGIHLRRDGYGTYLVDHTGTRRITVAA